MLSEWHRPTKKSGVRLKQERIDQARVCKGCNVKKKWVFSHRTGMKASFRDEDRKIWQGARCSDCVQKQQKGKKK